MMRHNWINYPSAKWKNVATVLFFSIKKPTIKLEIISTAFNVAKISLPIAYCSSVAYAPCLRVSEILPLLCSSTSLFPPHLCRSVETTSILSVQ